MSKLIRRIQVADYEDIHAINLKQGYNSDEERVKASILSLVEAGSDIILVAVVDGEVVGYVHGCPYNTLYTQRLINIIQYVFKTQYRDDEELKNMLLNKFEETVRKNGFQGIRMTANAERELLGKLFIEHGYESKRDLKHYLKYF